MTRHPLRDNIIIDIVKAQFCMQFSKAYARGQNVVYWYVCMLIKIYSPDALFTYTVRLCVHCRD